MQRELSVEELAWLLNVSQLTIRRDLTTLAEQGVVIRTHGGCIAAGSAVVETDYFRKVALNFELKQAIGKAAAETVKPDEIVLINDGSTTYHLASNLADIGGITVFTNSIAMIPELSRIPGLRLHILGGEYDHNLNSLSGALTEEMLDRLSFDRVFLGVDSVDVEGRCLVATPEEARLTGTMLKRGRMKILLADHTKFEAKGYSAYGTLNDFDTWFTTPGIDTEKVGELRNMTDIVEVIL